MPPPSEQFAEASAGSFNETVKRRAALGAFLLAIGAVTALALFNIDRPLTCEAWKAQWNSVADRFDATYVEFTEYVRAEPEPGLEGARPIYAYARVMDAIIGEAGDLPDPPENLGNARDFGLESLKMVTAGVRSVGEGIEADNQERVEWGAGLISQGRLLAADAGAASNCDAGDG